MLRCPHCQSHNIISNKPLTQAQIARVAEGAQFLQTLGNKRLGVVAGLAALGMQGVNALYRDYSCRECRHAFDIEGDQPSVI